MAKIRSKARKKTRTSKKIGMTAAQRAQRNKKVLARGPKTAGRGIRSSQAAIAQRERLEELNRAKKEAAKKKRQAKQRREERAAAKAAEEAARPATR
ncbi:MAG: hypothetical protein ACPG77_06990, partial [Nannocystaceae bacterium]